MAIFITRTSVVEEPPPSGDWQLAAGHFEAAKITMEIIAPRAGLSTANRYYKQYPGIAYRVPVVVLGGAAPFKYELTTFPSGMTIGSEYGDTDYGVIEWTNPVTSGSPHSVTVQVTDQEGTVATVSYTITVETAGFLFIDSVNGSDGNAGTLASPKQTINGWYNSAKTDDTYAGYFVYYRAGTYQTADAPVETGFRMACTSNDKPKIHMGYPGESATIDLAGNYWIYYGNSSGNYWWSGFASIEGITHNKGLSFDSGNGVDDITVFENTFADQANAGVTGQNPSTIFSAAGGGLSDYISIVGNTFLGLNAHDLFLGYSTRKGVVERNSITDNTGPGVYLKDDNQFWSIRFNEGLTSNTNSLARLDTWDIADDIEVCWNNYKTSGRGLSIGQEPGAIGELWDYRNTWQTPNNNSVNSGGGTWYATRNVVVHSGTYTQGYRLESGAVTITRTELLAATSGLIDSSTGLLTGTDRTNYLGIRGHEVA